ARADRPVWARAREAVVVKRDANPVLAILRGMRAWHWAKNLLVFVPLIAAHRIDPSSLFACALAAASFSLTASAVYLANDLLDLQEDRRHPLKQRRAIASGELDIAVAAALIPVLLVGATIIAVVLPWEFGALLAVYAGVNVAYSLALKRIVLLDVF